MKRLVLFGEIPVNCYFIEHNSKCYIVDPGYEKERIIKYINDHNFEVLGILLTHGHIDHIGAIDAFDVPVYIHKDEYEILLDNHKNGFEYYGREKPYDLEKLQVKVFDNDKEFFIEHKKIEVIHTPGHTIGSVCFKIDNNIYSGDTLFEGTVGKWDYPTGNLEQLKKSVVNLINSYDNDVKIHPAHGASTTIGDEKKYNHFYKEWSKI